MDKRIIISLALMTVLSLGMKAQGTDNELETDFGARLNVTADAKIKKGFHWTVEAEARMRESFSELGRLQAGTGFTYKLNDYLKVGAGYIFMENKNSSDEWKIRHRFYGNATVGFKAGDWRISLKERLQLTHRDVNNRFQDTPNSIALKSRLKVAYKGIHAWTPYVYGELRNVFNDPACSATWSTASQAYSDYSFLGYSDAYFNRLRGCLGTELKVSYQSAFDFYILLDYNYDKDIDTNKEGTKLKSLTYDRKLMTSLGVSYIFSF